MRESFSDAAAASEPRFTCSGSERASCSTDRRVVYAVITDAGWDKLETASDSHLAQVQALFDERFGPEELEQLAELLGRLPGAENASGEDCGT